MHFITDNLNTPKIQIKFKSMKWNTQYKADIKLNEIKKIQNKNKKNRTNEKITVFSSK